METKIKPPKKTKLPRKREKQETGEKKYSKAYLMALKTQGSIIIHDPALML